MDKKSKFAQPFLKGTTSEAKKSQDVAGSKLFPKSSRKREPVGTNNFSKNDQSRKSGCNTQKTKNFDKRPKSKGHYFSGPKENSQVEDLEAAEYGSVMVPGSKKQNLTHLLNFHHAPRDARGSQWGNRSGNSKYKFKSYGYLSAAQRHKYKELFLQANCQFVVAKNGNYSLYLNNPDALVEWNLVEQIRLHTFGKLACPICLSSPVAAKITRCGHVYCWHCILHYLQLSEKEVVKCPICFESVHKSDLKSVLGISQETANIGDEVCLRLMRRQKGSLIATEVEETDTPIPTTFFTVLENENRQGYSRLLLADYGDVLDIIAIERDELEIALAEDNENPENCFIQQAIEELKKRENVLLDSLANDVSGQAVIGKQQNEGEKIDNESSEIAQLAPSHSSDNLNGQKAEDKYYYFYQAIDGQNIYLHAMNVKMLEQEYKSLEECPRMISGKLLEIETRSLTPDLRCRLHFLNHLPLNCPFELVEIEMKTPLVSREVLDSYKHQITNRQKQRKDREHEERRRERKITEAENKLLGKYAPPEIHIESQFHFPDFQPEILYAETNGSSSPELDFSYSLVNDPVLPEMREPENFPVLGSNSNGTQSVTRSFAQTLSSPSLLKNDWPRAGSSRRSTASHTVTKPTENLDDDDTPKPPTLTVLDFIVPESSGKKSGGKKKKNKVKFRAFE